MHHEHHGDCCHPIEPYAPEHQEPHVHASELIGHICTAACTHEAPALYAAAAAPALAAPAELRPSVPSLETKAKKKTKKKRARLGKFGLLASAAAS